MSDREADCDCHAEGTGDAGEYDGASTAQLVDVEGRWPAENGVLVKATDARMSDI